MLCGIEMHLYIESKSKYYESKDIMGRFAGNFGHIN